MVFLQLRHAIYQKTINLDSDMIQNKLVIAFVVDGSGKVQHANLGESVGLD